MSSMKENSHGQRILTTELLGSLIARWGNWFLPTEAEQETEARRLLDIFTAATDARFRVTAALEEDFYNITDSTCPQEFSVLLLSIELLDQALKMAFNKLHWKFARVNIGLAHYNQFLTRHLLHDSWCKPFKISGILDWILVGLAMYFL
ncbi:MAG: hypothetical protein MMC33_009121 [Icmadophila ericetorum]|nr:hypothetical protein [Icmadophila ericetorum]